MVDFWKIENGESENGESKRENGENRFEILRYDDDVIECNI